jgi:hypothetical protein
MKYRNLFLILSLLAFSNFGKAQTTVSGSIYSSTTWALTGSPYIITNNIVLFGGATLTIEPGVEVRFGDGITFEVRGALVAEGTASKRIYFTAANGSPTRSIYKGFKIETSTASLKMAYCNTSYAYNVVDLTQAIGSFSIHNCAFTNNYYGVGDQAAGVYFTADSCYFENNKWGVGTSGFAKGTVKNCLFVNNEVGGEVDAAYNSVFLNNTVTGVVAYTTLHNCEVANNNVGVEWDGHASTSMTGNNIHDNAVGVKLDRFWNQSGIVFTNNKICGNTTWNLDYRGTNNATLNGNCWCTGDSSAIRTKISDGYVNIASGLVSFNAGTSCTVGINQSPVTSNPNPTNVPIPDVNVYPNPFFDHITIELSDTSSVPLTFLLIDKTGQVVVRVENIKAKMVNVSRDKLPAGLYFYQVRRDKQLIKTGKLIAE